MHDIYPLMHDFLAISAEIQSPQMERYALS